MRIKNRKKKSIKTIDLIPQFFEHYHGHLLISYIHFDSRLFRLSEYLFMIFFIIIISEKKNPAHKIRLINYLNTFN